MYTETLTDEICIPFKQSAPATERPPYRMYGYSKDAIHVSWNDPDASYGKPYSHYAIYVREITYDESRTYETGAWKLAMEILATRRYYVHVNAVEGVTYTNLLLR